MAGRNTRSKIKANRKYTKSNWTVQGSFSKHGKVFREKQREALKI